LPILDLIYDDSNLVNDISIIKVRNGFLWSQAVQPACLPTPSIDIELEINGKNEAKSPVCVVSGKLKNVITFN